LGTASCWTSPARGASLTTRGGRRSTALTMDRSGTASRSSPADPPAGFVLVAGDDGPRAALAPLAAAGARWDAGVGGARLLVCGTSQSEQGFLREKNARLEAARAGLPIVCIEDFPGNYRPVEGAPVRLVVVEGEFSVALYRRRLGRDCPEL